MNLLELHVLLFKHVSSDEDNYNNCGKNNNIGNKCGCHKNKFSVLTKISKNSSKPMQSLMFTQN